MYNAAPCSNHQPASNIRVYPVAYNNNLCMRFDVIKAIGPAEGRYVSVYAKSRLSLCEIEVYPVVATATSRSAMCSPRSVQSNCVKPVLSGEKYSDLSLTVWNKPTSFLRSVSSVLDEAYLNRTGLDASVCGFPRLQVRVDQGLWKLVQEIDGASAESQRDVPLLLPLLHLAGSWHLVPRLESKGSLRLLVSFVGNRVKDLLLQSIILQHHV